MNTKKDTQKKINRLFIKYNKDLSFHLIQSIYNLNKNTHMHTFSFFSFLIKIIPNKNNNKKKQFLLKRLINKF